jgi:hypothetical protein
MAKIRKTSNVRKVTTVKSLGVVGLAMVAFVSSLPTSSAAAARRQATSYQVCIRKANAIRSPSKRLEAQRACETLRRPTTISRTTVVITPTTAAPTTLAATTSSVVPSGGVPKLGGCSMFPADNSWNQRVDSLPLNPSSATWVNNIGANTGLHPDFGGPYGIPFKIVPATEPKLPITFTAYGAESDPGPYPIPQNAPIEGAPATDGDRHVLVLQSGACKLYELGRAFTNSATGGWNADVGATFDLNSNALRPETWTSADAAGLPMLPGLIRYEDIADGAVRHAIRFTVQCTQRAYIHPATHQAGQNNPNCPPMGARFRLKASFDTSKYSGQSKIILDGLKQYGMIVADNGGNWFITGSVDSRWDATNLETLKTVPGSAFEVVDTGPMIR